MKNKNEYRNFGAMKLLFSLMFTVFSITYLFGQQRDFYVRTTGPDPYLNYGLGDDRLGGAKMGYLDSNILLRVTDSANAQYKIRLAENHTAWIPKEDVTRVIGYDVPYYYTGSWLVAGDSVYDYVTVSTPERLPYNSRMELYPSRVVVDIFGATSNTNWINQLSSAKEIKNVWYRQVEDDVMQVSIELNHSTFWGYHIYYDSLQRLTIRIKRPPHYPDIQHVRVAIDAGHGGFNHGTTGRGTHVFEKTYALSYAKELEAELLRRGAQVFLTRETDTTLGIDERKSMLLGENPDLLVSIHFNNSSNDTVRGASTYYRYIGFRPLSRFVLSQVIKTGLEEFGNIGSFNFGLNGPTEYPNCLLEIGFLSNTADEKKIKDHNFRLLVAKRIADGIEDFLKNSDEK